MTELFTKYFVNSLIIFNYFIVGVNLILVIIVLIEHLVNSTTV